MEELNTSYLPKFDLDYIPKAYCEMPPPVMLEFKELPSKSQIQEATTPNNNDKGEYFYIPIRRGPVLTIKEFLHDPSVDELNQAVKNGLSLTIKLD